MPCRGKVAGCKLTRRRLPTLPPALRRPLRHSRPVSPSWASQSTTTDCPLSLSSSTSTLSRSSPTQMTNTHLFLMPSFSSTFSFRLSAFVLLVLPSIAFAQSPLTNLPVPPLQWLELTHRLSGSGPPALRDASIGFDESSRTIILFGGEVNGIPVQQTFLCVFFTHSLLPMSLTPSELPKT